MSLAKSESAIRVENRAPSEKTPLAPAAEEESSKRRAAALLLKLFAASKEETEGQSGVERTRGEPSMDVSTS